MAVKHTSERGNMPFERDYLMIALDANCLNRRVKEIRNRQIDNIQPWLLRCIRCIDLTTLNGDDTPSDVQNLVAKAKHPTRQLISSADSQLSDDGPKIQCAAVCVYPSRVADVNKAINTASVATGFPSGQYGLQSRLDEITYAISNGANEIDIVIDRSLALQGKWNTLYNELVAMRKACIHPVHMKSILAIGELGSLDNVYKASMVAMMAGTDFIKTSTGKENLNADLLGGLVMIRAIQHFYSISDGIKVGIKPAGGIKTVSDALHWMIMVYEELGVQWLDPSLFRIGASSLLDNVLKQFKA